MKGILIAVLLAFSLHAQTPVVGGSGSSAAQIQESLSGQTGCSTAGYTYAPQSGTCIPSAVGSASPSFTPSAINAFGDSLTAGSWATPWIYPWAAQLGIPSAGVNNYAVGGEKTANVTNEIVNNYIPTVVATQPINTMLAGTNDVITSGSGYVPIYTELLSSGVAYLGIPAQSKVTGGSVYSGATYTGTCASDSTFSQATGINCTSNGATATFTLVTYGGPIYIFPKVISGDAGTWTYCVDTCGTPTSSVTALAISGASSSLGYIRVSTIPSAGSHTIVFTKTNGSGNMPINSVGTPYSTNPRLSNPLVVLYEVPFQYGGANLSVINAYNAAVDAIQSQLFSDGLNIYLAPTSKHVPMSLAALDFVTTTNLNGNFVSGGTGYSGTYTFVGTGGTCSIQPQGQATFSGTWGPSTATINGNCTVPPTGYTQSPSSPGTGAVVAWYFAGNLHPGITGNQELLAASNDAINAVAATPQFFYPLTSVTSADQSFGAVMGSYPNSAVPPPCLNAVSFSGYSHGMCSIQNALTFIYPSNQGQSSPRFCMYPGGSALTNASQFTHCDALSNFFQSLSSVSSAEGSNTESVQPYGTPNTTIYPGLNLAKYSGGAGFASGLAFLANNPTYYTPNSFSLFPFCTYPAGTALTSTAQLTCLISLNLGTGQIQSSSLKTSIYTVATLPTGQAPGTQVMVSDAVSFTPGTCTGGGSDYMIAVYSGASWSCH